MTNHRKVVPKLTKRSDLQSQSSDKISAPQYMVAFRDPGIEASYVHILHPQKTNEKLNISFTKLQDKNIHKIPLVSIGHSLN